MTKIRIKSGDTVKVLTGSDKGKTGKVLQVFPRLGRVVVEGVNVSKRHLKSRGSQPGSRIDFFMPINISNVAPVNASGDTVRQRQLKRS